MTLALHGNSPTVTLDTRAANRWPIITSEDEEAVLQVLRNGDLSCDPVTKELELDYCRYFERKHALAHCNGTAALLAAFFAIGLQERDEVIVPSATFWASAVPMLWTGAVPVFCESELDRLGPDPDDVRKRITSRTKALVAVHLWGMPCRMTELLAIAREHGLIVIEDASHAHGATWRDRKCGTLGDLSIFSLQSTKLAPAGEGGILLTDREDFLERAICMGDMVRVLELQTPARRFAGTTFGMKTRMAPLSAAVARTQFRRMPERNARRNHNVQYLSRRLEPLGFHTFLPPDHIERVYFEFLVRYDGPIPRPMLVEALRAEGCDVTLPRYPLLHQQPLFTEGFFAQVARLDPPLPVYKPNALPVTEEGNSHLLRFPSFPSASQELLDQYADAAQKVISELG